MILNDETKGSLKNLQEAVNKRKAEVRSPRHALLVAGIVITIINLTLLGFLVSLQPRKNNGDINRDGRVDALDLSLVLDQWTDKEHVPQ